MATRIDRGVSQTDLRNDLGLLKDYLLRRAGRKLGDTNYQALLRNNALSDLTDSGQALTNVLEYLTDANDAAEVSLYGSYTISDWEVTYDFIDNEITKDFLLPLKGASIKGGVLGSLVNSSPRVRIEDRLSLSDSFYGRGTYPGLGAGPSAFFYRVPSGRVSPIGFIKFDFNTGTKALTSVVFYAPDGVSTITVSNICGAEEVVVLEFASYVNPSTQEEINLLGSEISIKLTKSTGVVELYDPQSGELVKNIYDILTQTVFQTIKFELVRPYSSKNRPKWFEESPNDSGLLLPGGADDLNPETTFAVINYTDGEFVPYTEKEFWYSRDYVGTRWTLTERALLDAGGPPGIYQDSNMRFFSPPTPVREYNDNWGIRWDGYLVLSNPGVRKYLFDVKTNTGVKIDIANGSGPSWTTVFNSLDLNGRVRTTPTSDQFYSKQSFIIDNINPRFIHYNNDDLSNYTAYVPISVRLFHGAFDKAYPDVITELEPNMFLKLLSNTDRDPKTYYSGDLTVNITDLGGGEFLLSPDLSPGLVSVLGALQDATASSSYSLISQNQSVPRLVENGVDENGEPVFTEETVVLPASITPIELTLFLDGTDIKITSFTGEAGTYVLRVAPSVSGYSSDTMWKARFISPSPSHKSYEDLVDGSFEPIVYKYEYNEKPPWWKVSEGHKYIRNELIRTVNTPLDGFIRNGFNPTLKSLAPLHGLYGNGAETYSSRPNLLLGEAKYKFAPDVADSQNYIGVRLTKNFLGEGGKIKFSGLPINNSTSSDASLLGSLDLGGSPNHLTASANRVGSKIVQLFGWEPNPNPDNIPPRFYLSADPTLVSANDNPVLLGLPPFSDTGAWTSPITITAVEKADDAGFTTTVEQFVAPLTLNVEKVVFNNGGTNYDLIAFTTTLQSILPNGPEADRFNTRYIRFYNEVDSAFQFSTVDSGNSISFSDVLKLTYYGPRLEFNASTEDGAVNYSTNLITVNNHGFTDLVTTPVFYRNNGNTSISGLTNNGEYYVYPPTSNTFYIVTASNYPTSGSIVDLVTGATGTHILSGAPDKGASEVPKPDADRVIPFGFDLSAYSSGYCYPPYAIGDTLLESIAINDTDLAATVEGNFDVFWGDHTVPATLGENYLEVTEKLEFSHSVLENQGDIITTTIKTLEETDYTHRLRIDFPIDPLIVAAVPDVVEHLGNQEGVKDTYYLFVNGRTTPNNPASTMLPGL